MIATLLPATTPQDDDDDLEDEDVTREVTIVLLRLIRTQAISQLDAMDSEMELLRNAPQESGPSRQLPLGTEDSSWRLDRVPNGGPDGRGPLLDDKGRVSIGWPHLTFSIDHSSQPLRTFTILPSGQAAERARLQAQVFRPDHRLPTMTIDEYLEEERKRGNIISGGG